MYNFITVCAYGVSSSIILKRILQNTVEKVAKDKNINVKVESLDLISAKQANADAIFTSTKELSKELQKTTNAPVYPINNLTDEDEIAKVVDDFIKYYTD